MLLDDEIKDLVKKIELTDTKDSESLTSNLRELITRLKTNLQNPEVAERYELYKKSKGNISQYPIDADGFAVAFDPLEDEEGFWNTWLTYGIVVGKNVVSKEVCEHAIQRMHEITREISDGQCELDKPDTWKNAPVDSNGISFISRGFFEVYHDKALSDIRQSIRLYIHHVMIWGKVDLWTSFDRLGVKLPGHEESYALPLHVDQNPLIHPGFKTVQGVVALADCPVERGTFVGVPGSRAIFADYGRFAPGRGEFVELMPTDPIADTLKQNAQPIPLRAGHIVSWDSRTTHANTENKSKETRYVAYIAAGPAHEESQEFIDTRMDAFRTGVGSNVREALMHASKKARYSNYEKLAKVREPEQLTLLGRLLYGQESYEKI
jgi:hypothetical protein